MTAPLSQDLRKRLVRAVDKGASAREAAACTREALRATIGGLLSTFTSAECRNYLVKTGYAFE